MPCKNLHMVHPGFLDHVVLFVSNLELTKRFYDILLGPAVFREEHSLMYMTGNTRLFFAIATKPGSNFDKEGIGLNHLAFGVRSLEELQQIASQLDSSGIRHSGVQIDRYGQREFIWLDDPDGLRVEFYLRFIGERD
ncbi:MAG: VOC family protein [Blastocatellia bacterium]